jgi:hypothetical protein
VEVDGTRSYKKKAADEDLCLPQLPFAKALGAEMKNHLFASGTRF